MFPSTVRRLELTTVVRRDMFDALEPLAWYARAGARARKLRGLSVKHDGGFLARLRPDTTARVMLTPMQKAMPDRQSSVVRPARELKRLPSAWSGESDEGSSDRYPLLIPAPQKSNPTERMRRIDTMLEFAVTGSLGVGCEYMFRDGGVQALT